MRKAWVGISLIFVAFPALAAVQYDFIQHTQSDIAQLPPTNLSGRATVDRAHARASISSAAISIRREHIAFRRTARERSHSSIR